jgi:hypothetical protein
MYVSFSLWMDGTNGVSSHRLEFVEARNSWRDRSQNDSSKRGREVSTSSNTDQPTPVWCWAQLTAIFNACPGGRDYVQCLKKYCIWPTPCSVLNGRKPPPLRCLSPYSTVRDVVLINPHLEIIAGKALVSKLCSSIFVKWPRGRGYPGLVRYIEK